MEKILESQRRYFVSDVTKPYAFRIAQLKIYFKIHSTRHSTIKEVDAT